MKFIALSRRDVYHTNPNCPTAPEKRREVSENEIEWYDIRECKWCAGDNPNAKSGAGNGLSHKLKRIGEERSG